MTSKLREAREKAGYTIEHIADKLNIRKQYLIALEEEDYESMPGQIYIDGYTKIYYEFLGINLPLDQNDSLQSANPLVVDTDTNIRETKYKKYIIIFSVILLVLVVTLFNFLRSHNRDEITFTTSQQSNLNYGSKQESFNGSYKTD